MTAPTQAPADPRPEFELLLTYAVGDLLTAWPSGSAEAVRDALAGLLPRLADFYGPAAATLGADWYDEVRAAQQAPGRFRAIPATLPDLGRFDTLARWGVGPLFQAEPDLEAAQAKVVGGFTRIIGDAHRDTVVGSLAQDPQGKGWRRQTVGETCDFCTAIAANGAVYSARTANFSSHDDCDCIAVPEFGPAVKVRPYVPSTKYRSEAARKRNNRRLRDHLARTGAA